MRKFILFILYLFSENILAKNSFEFSHYYVDSMKYLYEEENNAKFIQSNIKNFFSTSKPIIQIRSKIYMHLIKKSQKPKETSYHIGNLTGSYTKHFCNNNLLVYMRVNLKNGKKLSITLLQHEKKPDFLDIKKTKKMTYRMTSKQDNKKDKTKDYIIKRLPTRFKSTTTRISERSKDGEIEALHFPTSNSFARSLETQTSSSFIFKNKEKTTKLSDSVFAMSYLWGNAVGRIRIFQEIKKKYSETSASIVYINTDEGLKKIQLLDKRVIYPEKSSLQVRESGIAYNYNKCQKVLGSIIIGKIELLKH